MTKPKPMTVSEMGRLGGSVRSKAKALAAARNWDKALAALRAIREKKKEKVGV